MLVDLLREAAQPRAAVPSVEQAYATETGRYRPDIDGLRAVAVAAVLLFHASGWSGGFVGVDVFFVISGFLIIGIVDRELVVRAFQIPLFYERRIRRLFPAFFAVALATLAAAFALLMPTDLVAFGKSLVAAVAFLSNVKFWMEAGYFDSQSAVKPLLHTWSLAVEEQFYLALPLFLIACHWLFRRGRAAALWLVLAGSLALSVWLTDRNPDVSFYLPFGRIWELALGGVLLFLPPGGGRWKGFSTLGLVLIAASIVLYTADTAFPGLTALLPCLGSAAVLYGGGQGIGAAVLRATPMVYLGRISYPLYLWHWPILALGRYALGTLSPMEAAAGLALAFVLAVLTYHLLEKPIRARRWLRTRRTLFAAAALGSIALIAAGLGLVLSHGAPGRLPARAVALDAAAEDKPTTTCHDPTPADVAARRLCVIGAHVAPTVVVWGDSEGLAAQSAIDQALKRLNLAAYVATRDGCIPAVGAVRQRHDPTCPTFASAVQRLAVALPARQVLIVGAWAMYETPQMRAGAARGWPAAEAALRGTVTSLRRAGVKVVLFDPPPGAKLPPPRVLAQQAAFGRTLPVAYTAQEFLQARYFRIAPTLPVVRVQAWRAICQQVCAVELDGRPLYFDSGHPARSTVGYMEPYIEAALRAPAPKP
jgi:peptidoglycan/LPS O-acetylase OafA/YrhL